MTWTADFRTFFSLLPLTFYKSGPIRVSSNRKRCQLIGKDFEFHASTRLRARARGANPSSIMGRVKATSCFLV